MRCIITSLHGDKSYSTLPGMCYIDDLYLQYYISCAHAINLAYNKHFWHVWPKYLHIVISIIWSVQRTTKYMTL